ncbi:hypothetical protein WMY93_018704 [Mugilogobius chulae]|uniref:Uncharacterized protein n=1 Tax=Mugilogobius chulae TaxID=88201 RepID=A0AAW0NUV0_9GOBI
MSFLRLSCPDAASASLDLAVTLGSEGTRRRTRRYLPSGSAAASRKNSDRFRTQPITANERGAEQWVRPEAMDEVEEEDAKGDVKTDDRAKMSVAAKMSLFKVSP